MTRRLLLLNGLAALSIATYHASAYGFSALFLWTDRYRPVTVPNYDQIGSMSYYMLLAIRQLDAFAIPSFIFISGYFVAFTAGRQKKLQWSLVSTRVRNFLIPFILWTIIRFLLLRQFPSSINDVLRPYYYIVLLIQFYMLAPYIVRFAQTRWQLLLLITAAIQVGAESIFFLNDLGVSLADFLLYIKDMLPLWFFPLRIFWFALGVVAGFHRESLSRWLAETRWLLLASALILAPLTIIEYLAFAYLSGHEWLGPSFRGLISRLYGLAFIFAFLAFDKISIPFSKHLNELGSKSLGIYLANIPTIYAVSVFMYRKTPWILGNQFLYQAVLIFTGLAVPLLLMSVISRTQLRWTYRYLFG